MKNVILVDDSLIFLEVMHDYVMNQRKDVKCVKFYDPRDVLHYLANGNPIDVLITDYQMPRINGIELAHLVLQRHRHTRIIICSGYDKEYLEKRGREYGLMGVVGVEDKIEICPKSKIRELIQMI